MGRILRILERDFIVLLVLAIVFVGGLFIGKAKLGLEEEIPDIDVKKPYELVTDAFDHSKKAETVLVAVDSNGDGVGANLLTEVRDGTGLVLVNINDVLADVNAQYSARVAKIVAENLSEMDLSEKDVVFNIVTNATVVGGQSAGSAMALSVLGLVLNKEVNRSVLVTGAIDENGTIVDASEIFQKAKAAKEYGGEIMLVPLGASEGENQYIKVRKCGDVLGLEKSYCETEFTKRKINIGSELGVKVVEVGNVKEAMEYYFI